MQLPQCTLLICAVVVAMNWTVKKCWTVAIEDICVSPSVVLNGELWRIAASAFLYAGGDLAQFGHDMVGTLMCLSYIELAPTTTSSQLFAIFLVRVLSLSLSVPV